MIDTKTTDRRIILDLKTLCLQNVLVLGRYNYNEVGKELKMHRHEGMIEICYLDRGSQHYQIESKQYMLKGGDLLITPPSLLHGTSGYPEEKGCLYWMIIKMPEKQEKISNLSSFESQYLMKRLLAISYIQFRGAANIKIILNNIFNAYQKVDGPLRKIGVFNYILEFLLQVIYYGECRNKGEISEKIKFVCTYIEENILEQILLEDLADRSGLSLSRFKHRFKEETGIPPAEYILRKKIDRSKEMIQNTDLAIQDIAYTLDFSSSPYFATVFKRFIGMTPLEFRKFEKEF